MPTYKKQQFVAFLRGREIITFRPGLPVTNEGFDAAVREEMDRQQVGSDLGWVVIQASNLTQASRYAEAILSSGGLRHGESHPALSQPADVEVMQAAMTDSPSRPLCLDSVPAQVGILRAKVA